MKRAAWEAWLPLGVPLALAAVVFARAAWFPFVNWDDPSHFADNPLTEHPLARGLAGLFQTREIGYPAPLLLLSFALDHALWGWHPAPYHAENVALHLASVAMLFRVARRIGLSPWEACAASTLFAVHPLVVEPVCWVTGRKDVLSTAMMLGAALVAAGDAREGGMSAPWRWAAANAIAVGAVLVLPREVVASLLIVVLVHGMRPEWPVRAVASRMAGAFAVAVGIVIVGGRQLTALGGVPLPRSPANVVADIAAAWALQLGHFLLPVDLLAYYFREPGDPAVWWMVTAAGCAVAGLAFAAFRTARGSPVRVGAALAVIAYGPVSGLFVIRRWTADSYLYVPILAMGLALVPAVARAWPPRLARFGVFAAGAFALAFAFLSFVGATRWSSSVAVWSGSIAHYPMEPLSYEHEALALRADGRLAEAEPLFLEMAEKFPDWEDTLDDEALAYEARGDTRRAMEVLGRGVRAGSSACVQLYWRALLSAPTPPDPSQRDVVRLAFREGLGPMREAVRDPAVFRRVAAVLQSVGLNEEAREAESEATRLAPGSP